MKMYFTELYFFKDELKDKGLYSELPTLDKYSVDTVLFQMSGIDWDYTKGKIIEEYPGVAFIHLHKSDDLRIS